MTGGLIMTRYALHYLLVAIVGLAVAGNAFAQSAPIGTWKGTINGPDTGTITIVIDNSLDVTVTVHSNYYMADFVCTGTLYQLAGLGNMFVTFSDWDVYPVWQINSNYFDAGGPIQGMWVSVEDNLTREGNFTANFVSSSVGGTTPGALGGNLSGSWYDPAQSGQGFALEFTGQPSGTNGENLFLAYWYVYTPDGSGHQNWIVAGGAYDTSKNTITVPAQIFSGAAFPPFFNSNDVKPIDWGTLTFTFSDCDTGTVSWNSSVAGYGSGSMPIKRLTSIAGTSCQ
jgi:hypothetical protein